jgi:hypothetical protein
MLVKVAGFSQDMDFHDGSITNFVTLELPNGSVVKAIVSDDGARQLIEARAAMGPLPQAPAPSRAPAVQQQQNFSPGDFGHTETDDDGAVVFGGGGTNDAEAPGEFWPGGAPQEQERPAADPKPSPYAHADPAVQQRLYQEHQAELRKRAKRGPTMGRTVPKDDLGNPIVPTNGGVDPYDVMGGSGGGVVDEDGVGQL